MDIYGYICYIWVNKGTGRPKKNGDKILTHIYHFSLCSIRFQYKLYIPLENIGQYVHFEYN